ncbi:MAG TPA: orotidine-5'-phosphate decarboxylase [Legionella sp.]|nr:orotidine-5'-phosphate decarboxylase [Legionella sp.]
MHLIIALDFNNESTAFTLVDQLDPSQCALKVGSEMFTLLGAPFVRALITRGFKVFLDLKFHDIPNTVARASMAAADLGVWMLTVHASGGLKMMQAARDAIEPYGDRRPLVVAVTVLTSMSEAELSTLGIQAPLQSHVGLLAGLAHEARLDGIVCSALDTMQIKRLFGERFLAVTPGIRQPGDAMGDQSRIVTPAFALNAGSDYLVVGRSITSAAHPMTALRDFL